MKPNLKAALNTEQTELSPTRAVDTLSKKSSKVEGTTKPKRLVYPIDKIANLQYSYEFNPELLQPSQVSKIKGSILGSGLITDPIVALKFEKQYFIIDGKHRIEALKQILSDKDKEILSRMSMVGEFKDESSKGFEAIKSEIEKKLRDEHSKSETSWAGSNFEIPFEIYEFETLADLQAFHTLRAGEFAQKRSKDLQKEQHIYDRMESYFATKTGTRSNDTVAKICGVTRKTVERALLAKRSSPEIKSFVIENYGSSNEGDEKHKRKLSERNLYLHFAAIGDQHDGSQKLIVGATSELVPILKRRESELSQGNESLEKGATKLETIQEIIKSVNAGQSLKPEQIYWANQIAVLEFLKYEAQSGKPHNLALYIGGKSTLKESDIQKVESQENEAFDKEIFKKIWLEKHKSKQLSVEQVLALLEEMKMKG